MLSPNDALLLAAVVADGGMSDLDGLIATIDYLDRSTLTFDDVSYGLTRLRAGGWVTVEGGERLLLSVTDRTSELVDRIGRGVGVIDLRFPLADALAATRQEQDRSLGRLAELDPATFEAATARYLGRVPPDARAMTSAVSAAWAESAQPYAPYLERSRRAGRRMG